MTDAPCRIRLKPLDVESVTLELRAALATLPPPRAKRVVRYMRLHGLVRLVTPLPEKPAQVIPLCPASAE